MKLIWLSDLHLEFIGESQLRAFIQEVLNEKPDAVLMRPTLSMLRSAGPSWKSPETIPLKPSPSFAGMPTTGHIIPRRQISKWKLRQRNTTIRKLLPS